MLKEAQQQASRELSYNLRTHGLALLWGQIRSGKTRSFLDASRPYRTLVVTKKDSISGIISEAKEIGVNVDVINYHSIQKKDPNEYQLIILDECHLYIASATPKFKPIWKEVKKFTQGKFCIFASGTPTPETYAGLYTMLALSDWTPFKHSRFTLFFEEFGVPSRTYIGSRDVPCYKRTQDKKLLKQIKPYVVSLTRKDTGHKHEAKDVYHKIEMNKQQLKILNALDKDKLYLKGDYEILADTPIKALIKKHQIAGGIAIKSEDDSLFNFKNTPPKVKYIRENFDLDTTIILSHYIHEQEYLKDLFPHTGSVTKMSTGVDLSHFKTMVIYSMAFSSANYEQVKGRLMNVNRKKKIRVHYLVSGIDEYVLKAVKNKENFTSRWYRGARK